MSYMYVMNKSSVREVNAKSSVPVKFYHCRKFTVRENYSLEFTCLWAETLATQTEANL